MVWERNLAEGEWGWWEGFVEDAGTGIGRRDEDGRIETSGKA